MLSEISVAVITVTLVILSGFVSLSAAFLEESLEVYTDK